MVRTVKVGALLMAMASVTATEASAQRARQAPAAGERRAQQNRPVQNRAMLERRVRQEFYRAARMRIGLNDDQMRKLGDVNAKYEVQRRAMNREERQTRQALRAAIQSKSPDEQGKIDGYMNSLQQLQRRRLELNENEQRDLAGFMTPAQRAQYHALQETVRRRLEELRRSRGDALIGDDSIAAPPF